MQLLTRLRQRATLGPPISPEETSTLQESLRETWRHAQRVQPHGHVLRERVQQARSLLEDRAVADLSEGEQKELAFLLKRIRGQAWSLPKAYNKLLAHTDNNYSLYEREAGAQQQAHQAGPDDPERTTPPRR